MLQILALLLGFLSWGTLVLSIAKRKKNTAAEMYRSCFLAWLFCAAGLYIPSLCQFLEFKAADFASVIDCASTYHLASVGLLLVTFCLTILTLLLHRKHKEPA